MDEYIEKHRPPPNIREQLDLSYRIIRQSVEIFEVRPVWDNPKEKVENGVAKATYVKKTGVWKIYWQRADLKWHAYEPNLFAVSLEDVLDVVEEDEYACFYG